MFLKKIVNKIPACLLSVIITVLIAYVSLDDNPFDMHRVRLFEGADKVAHCVMYLCLSSVYIFDCAKVLYPERLKLKSLIFCSFIAFIFSLIIELLQEYMGLGRTASLYDMIANLAGTLAGLLIMKYYFLKRLNDIMSS